MTTAMHQCLRPFSAAAITARRARVPAGGAMSVGLGLCVFVGLLPASHAALAQGRLDAQYEATLAGIPVGKGAWTIDIGDDKFSASAQGGTPGLFEGVSGGTG